MGKKILVVDDEAHIVHVVSMKLTNAGYDVITAMDGEEALELCVAENPDLIITDYQMPFMSGMELCKRLRREPSVSETPAILLTARGHDVEPEDVAEARIETMLAKPFSPRELLEKVNEIFSDAADPAAVVE